MLSEGGREMKGGGKPQLEGDLLDGKIRSLEQFAGAAQSRMQVICRRRQAGFRAKKRMESACRHAGGLRHFPGRENPVQAAAAFLEHAMDARVVALLLGERVDGVEPEQDALEDVPVGIVGG